MVGLIHADELIGMEELEKDTSVDIFDRSTNNVRKPEVIKKLVKLARFFQIQSNLGRKAEENNGYK